MLERAEDAEAPVVGVLDVIRVKKDAQRRGGELPVVRQDMVADGGDPAVGKGGRDRRFVPTRVGEEDVVAGLVAGGRLPRIRGGDGARL